MTSQDMHRLYTELPAYEFFEIMESEGYRPGDIEKVLGGEPIAKEFARWIYLTQK